MAAGNKIALINARIKTSKTNTISFIEQRVPTELTKQKNKHNKRKKRTFNC